MGNSDPLLSLLKDFSYNVVRLPRTGIRPLQILEKQDNDLVVLGEVPDLFKAGSVALPPAGPEEQATFINGQKTRDLKISVGLSLLGGIIGAMTGTKVKLDVGYKKASALAFEFDDVKVNQVNQLQMSKFLTAARIDETVGPPAKLLEADKLYLITSTIKSKKFTAEAKQSGGKSVEVDVPIIKSMVGGSVGIRTEGGSNSKISYEGNIPLVFGFQAVRMEFENGLFKGFKAIKTGEAGMREIRKAKDVEEQNLEMLETDGPFVNFFDPTPDSTEGAAGKGGVKGAAKGAGGSSGSKKSAAKSSTKKGGGASKGAKSGGAKRGTSKGSAKKSSAKKGAKGKTRSR